MPSSVRSPNSSADALPVAPDEKPQQAKLGPAEVDPPVAAPDLAPVLVEHEPADLKALRAAYAPARGVLAVDPPEDAPDLGDQDLQAEGLGDVVVAAVLHGEDLVSVTAPGGEEDDRYPGHRSYLPAPEEAVVVREVDVEHDEVRAKGQELVPHPGEVGHDEWCEAIASEAVRDRLP